LSAEVSLQETLLKIAALSVALLALSALTGCAPAPSNSLLGGGTSTVAPAASYLTCTYKRD
jgi:hypothetical protein